MLLWNSSATRQVRSLTLFARLGYASLSPLNRNFGWCGRVEEKEQDQTPCTGGDPMKADRRVLLGVGLLLMWGMSGVHNLAAQDAADNTDPQAAEPDQN